MTKKSIYASLILLLITTFTFSSSASFANVKNNTNITHNDKGVNVIITRANVKEIDKKLEDSKILSTFNNNNNQTLYSTSQSIDGYGVSSTNNNVQVRTAGQISAHTVSIHKLKVQDGYTVGYWWGSNPVNAQTIVLRQRYSFNGTVLSVSWPPGFTGSTTVREWISAEYRDTWRAQAMREVAEGTSLISLFSVTVEDGADVYISNVCHKARYTIKKGIWDFVF